MKKSLYKIALSLLITVLMFSGCASTSVEETTTEMSSDTTISTTVAEITSAETTTSTKTTTTTTTQAETSTKFSLDDIPAYSGNPVVEVNGNKPYFTKSELKTKSYEYYGKLDSLGRCTTCVACIGRDLQPTEKRGEIGMIKPTGWHTVKYDNVNGKYLYNRCHLIGYQLTAENANPKNLITGTRALNVDGMLPYEDLVDDYLEMYNNHVMYRVTPVFKGKELVARGVLMEGYSVEDNGAGVCFNVYCYNNQPDIKIDYATGDSQYVGKSQSNSKSKSTKNNDTLKADYIVNTNTRKFHKPSCQHVKKMSASNKKSYKGYRDNLVKNGYSPCGTCKP